MPFIAVHVGAGYHAVGQRDNYKIACRTACLEAIKYLDNNCSAIDGVVAAIASLEDNSLTNAGLGSNLNADGVVECDASLMSGSDLKWGAVGAIRGIKNPIKAAQSVVKEQDKPLPLGLIPPSILVGDGARLHALRNGCVASDLNTEKSLEAFNKYKRRLESVGNGTDVKRNRLDTVGAICVDSTGNVASGVSSGGIALKQSGRIGQASMMGCGAWAEDSVAATTTGVGEYLIKTVFAKECAQRLLRTTDGNYLNSLRLSFDKDFIHSPFLRSIPIDDRLGGVLALIYDRQLSQTELVWGHSTASMCLGFMSSHSLRPKVLVSEMSDSKPGTSFVVETKLIK